MKVVIDPGHGGSDPGAIGPSGTREADNTLAVAMEMRDCLTAAGHEVILTREEDRDVAYPGASAEEELKARCDIANTAGAESFVSIHNNAANTPLARGAETWYYMAGEELAGAIQRQLAGLGLVDRGIKRGSFYVLRHTDMPATLVEIAFITNPEEEKLLADPEFQAKAAKAITAGILGGCHEE